ncbi:MAG: hypothetical protein KatS3mg014_1362 [Actinomycetota bacterium]|nr:MAG: hypothetical protein KatS3mg014_1362 [Actinomycetota bacterium]
MTFCYDRDQSPPPSPSESPSPSEPPSPSESPSPSEPPSPLSLTITKTNDADRDGTYTDAEEAPSPGADVRFLLVISNTSDVPVVITGLTDAFGGTTLDLLLEGCAELDGSELGPGATVTCTFTLPSYAPPGGAARENVAEVCVLEVDGDRTACDEDGSRVTSAEVLGTTVTPTPTETKTPPSGTAFTGAGGMIPLGALTLLLLTVGSGLLRVGSRRLR